MTLPAFPEDRVLRVEIVLDAPVEEVFALWTTEEGVRSFFAPGCRVEPRVDGAYEIHFDPAAPSGTRGTEGSRILVFEPPRRLAFSWNAPPEQPSVRAQRTVVTVDLVPEDERRTRLRFTHSGWGEGPEWDRAYSYFDRAWAAIVLPYLVHRIARGPIDWSELPTVTAVAPTLKLSFAPRID